MSESKHTPGPWVVYADLPSTDPDWHIVTTANKRRVLANVHIEPGNEADRANARLIAAAPNMLEALKQALTHIERDEETHGRNFAAGNVARAAIAKAEPSHDPS